MAALGAVAALWIAEVDQCSLELLLLGTATVQRRKHHWSGSLKMLGAGAAAWTMIPSSGMGWEHSPIWICHDLQKTTLGSGSSSRCGIEWQPAAYGAIWIPVTFLCCLSRGSIPEMMVQSQSACPR